MLGTLVRGHTRVISTGFLRTRDLMLRSPEARCVPRGCGRYSKPSTKSRTNSAKIVEYLKAGVSCLVVVCQSSPSLLLRVWFEGDVESAMRIPRNAHRLRDSSINGCQLPLDAASLFGGGRQDGCRRLERCSWVCSRQRRLGCRCCHNAHSGCSNGLRAGAFELH